MEQLLVDTIQQLSVSFNSVTILRHNGSRQFLGQIKDLTVRMQVTKALVTDQLEISSMIPLPDPASPDNWSVLHQLVGRKLRRTYRLRGVGFEYHHEVPETEIEAFTAFKYLWLNLYDKEVFHENEHPPTNRLRKREEK